MMNWPRQSACDEFYGNPRGRDGSINKSWAARNLLEISPPFAMHMDKTPIRKFPVHRSCADGFMAWLEKVWSNAGHDQSVIAQWGMDVFSGSFNFRPMRGSSHLSMHAYGCAIDIDAPRNGFHCVTPHFATLRKQVVKPFLDLGGIWGGDWNGNGSSIDERRCDGMHFQFAHLG
jgi:hypothetical protein